MLKRLKLHRFRYIEPGTELVFNERFNVLLGRNGTGKTTLLDLISMVLRSDFSALRGEEFDIEYEWADGRESGRVRFENKRKTYPPGPPAATASIGGEAPRHRPHVTVQLRIGYEYEIDVDGAVMRSRRGGGEWEDGALVDVFERGFLLTLAWSITTLSGIQARTYLNVFSQYGPFAYRFDESLGVFDSITADDAGRAQKRVVGLDARFDPGTDTINGIRSRFVPLGYRPARPEPGQSSSKVELSPHDSSLASFPELAGLKHMSMSFAVEGSHQEPDGVWWRFGHAEFLFSGPRDVVFNHGALSYGQKRLLAFLYYLDATRKFVIADELVNGMHHEWIRACLDEIGDRQAFLTSQNPLLLDYLPLESAEQVEKTFIQCRTEGSGDDAQIVWSNLSPEDAAELFADYRVGIQHVGEILRVRGLW